jgi:hypothetical protein
MNRSSWSPPEERGIAPDGGILVRDTGDVQEWIVPEQPLSPEEKARADEDVARMGAIATQLWADVFAEAEELARSDDRVDVDA